MQTSTDHQPIRGPPIFPSSTGTGTGTHGILMNNAPKGKQHATTASDVHLPDLNKKKEKSQPSFPFTNANPVPPDVR